MTILALAALWQRFVQINPNSALPVISVCARFHRHALRLFLLVAFNAFVSGDLLAASAPAITSSLTSSGQVGVAFSYQITASRNPTGFNATGLPAGLSVNTSSGVISGTPTTAGNSSVTISATNSGGSGTATLAMTITSAKPAINSATTATGQVGVAFSYQITATGSPTSFSATGLPAGLSINSATGIISGTPTTSGSSSVLIGATNAAGTGTATLTLTVNPAGAAKPAITSATVASAQIGLPFSYQITATNNPTSFSATGLPAGLSINTTTGVISGTPKKTGSSNVTIRATNAVGTGTGTLALTVTVAKPVITSATTAAAQVGVSFSYQITASNNPTSFSASGLPSGLTINTSTGLISGVPTLAGTASVTIGATNTGGTGSAVLSLAVEPAKPVVSSPTTATGQVGVVFSYQITASNNPTSYSATGLPAGLTVDSTSGVISGTPSSAGATSVALGATNAGGTGTGTLTITINPPAPQFTSASTASGQVGAAFLFQVTATNGPTSFSATGLPAGLTLDPSTGLISGTPSRPGESSVIVTATNTGGSSSATILLTILATLPYATDFEAVEGYSFGPLNGQLGWTVVQGSSSITGADFASGGASLLLSATTPAGAINQTFAPSAGAGVVYVDLFARPVAEIDVALATSFTIEGAKFAFQRSGDAGTLYSQSGDGAGGTNWRATSYGVPLTDDHRTQNWTRLTARLDFSRQAWDLYANGQMVAADLGFLSGSSSYLSRIALHGSPTADSGLDDLYAGASNPLFADVNNNGIDDAWETAHGLSLAADNRNTSPTGNGVTVVQAYVNGTDPNDFFNGTAPTLTILGGNNQTVAVGEFNPQPFDAGVWNPAGTAPLVNAPVTFTVQDGGGQLAATNTGNPALSSTLNLLTDVDGTVRVYYKQPLVAGVSSLIKVTAGGAQTSFTSTSRVPDGDGNGIVDTWELEHFGYVGIDPTADPDRDGLTNLQEFQRGTNPHNRDTDGDGVRDGLELTLGMNPNASDADALPAKISGLRLLLKSDSITTDADGYVSVWTDQSGLGNHATSEAGYAKPQVVANQVNGHPVVRFDGVDDMFTLPNVMSGATAGEILAVVKVPDETRANTLWTFSGNNGTTYSYGSINDDFGLMFGSYSQPTSGTLTQYHLYNVSVGSGLWVQRINGVEQLRQATPSATFNSTPTIGSSTSYYYNSTGYLKGDIAEIIIYDHVLTEAEREAVNTYLTRKYTPPAIPVAAAPTNVQAVALSPTQVNLAWTIAEPQLATTAIIERKSGSGDYAAIAENENSFGYTDSGLTPGTTYTYRIKLRSLAGTSEYSQAVTVTTPLGGLAMPTNGMRLWLKADEGVAGVGPLTTWYDQSGLGNHATSSTPNYSRPQVVANQTNGRPVVRFDGSDDMFTLPNVMNGATAGEILAVVKVPDETRASTLWTFSGTNGTTYSYGSINDDFGLAFGSYSQPASGTLTQYHLYNVSVGSGLWVQRVNGVEQLRQVNQAVTFNSAPTIGSSTSYYYNSSGYLKGDIAEIIVYDHVLTDSEREAANTYLTLKYAPPAIPVPAAPVNVQAVALSPTQVSLAWTIAEAQLATTAIIERKSGSSDYVIVAEKENSFGHTDTGLTSGTTYTYRIKLRGLAGTSEYSQAVTVTTPLGGLEMPTNGMRLWLKADEGVSGVGPLTTWYDQSGLGNHASSGTSYTKPQVVANQANGRPVVRFDGSDDMFTLPGVMNGATAGEILAVVKVPDETRASTLWTFSGTNGTTYSYGSVNDDFGLAFGNYSQPSSGTLTQYHLYNVSVGSGLWIQRINGVEQLRQVSQAVTFNSAPTIGSTNTYYFGSSGYLKGDIAEIIVYDQVLTDSEREAVNTYLTRKYAPSAVTVPTAPTNIQAIALSPTQVNLAWTITEPQLATTAIIERKSGPGDYIAVAERVNSFGYTDTGLMPGTSYTYRIKLRGLAGTSEYSQAVTVTTPLGGLEMSTNGIRLWLKADEGIAGVGPLTTWYDQSGLGNHATSASSYAKPQVVSNQLNGRPVVRFDGSDDTLTLPNVMNGATAGEILAVVKVPDQSRANTLWRFSGTNGTRYNYGSVYDDFGLASGGSSQSASSASMEYHLYNVSVDSGLWVQRVNGVEQLRQVNQGVTFNSAPTIGSSNYNYGTDGYLKGDIAEIIIYDRVLMDSERAAVCFVLASKYQVVDPAQFSQ